MFGFDMEDIMNGYSKQDEFVARDTIIVNLLIEKHIVTKEEVEEKFKSLPTIIEQVHNNRIEETKRKADEARERLELYKNDLNRSTSTDPANFDTSYIVSNQHDIKIDDSISTAIERSRDIDD